MSGQRDMQEERRRWANLLRAYATGGASYGVNTTERRWVRLMRTECGEIADLLDAADKGQP